MAIQARLSWGGGVGVARRRGGEGESKAPRAAQRTVICIIKSFLGQPPTAFMCTFQVTGAHSAAVGAHSAIMSAT